MERAHVSGMAANSLISPAPRRPPSTGRPILLIGASALSLISFRAALIRHLRANGNHVIGCAGLRPEDPATEIQDQLSAWGVDFRILPLENNRIQPWGDLRFLGRLLKIIRETRPQILLAYNIKPVVYTGWLGRWAGVPTRVAMITGLGNAFAGTGTPPRIRRRFFTQLYRFGLRGFQGVIFQNEDDHRELVDTGVVPPTQKTCLIRGSGVDLDKFKEEPMPEFPPVFLMITRLIRPKGVLEYVEAARRLKAKHSRVRFQLLAQPCRNPQRLDSSLLENWRREKNLEILPPCADVRPALRACHVLVLPSYREGTPNVVLEAMATGRAIVTTDVPGCRQTVEPGGNGWLVPARDSVALELAMETLIARPETVWAMGRKSRWMAEERFDQNEQSRRLVAWMGLTGA